MVPAVAQALLPASYAVLGFVSLNLSPIRRCLITRSQIAMSRLALRYYLPILQVVVLAGLFAASEIERYEAAHRPPQQVGWDIRTDCYHSRPIAEAVGALNAPAVLTILPLQLILPNEPEWPLITSAFIAIILFWYVLGRCFDRLRGLIRSQPIFQRSKKWRQFAWIATLTSALAFALGVFLLIEVRSEEVVWAFPLLIWSGLSGLTLIAEMRRPGEPDELTFLMLKS